MHGMRTQCEVVPKYRLAVGSAAPEGNKSRVRNKMQQKTGHSGTRAGVEDRVSGNSINCDNNLDYFIAHLRSTVPSSSRQITPLEPCPLNSAQAAALSRSHERAWVPCTPPMGECLSGARLAHARRATFGSSILLQPQVYPHLGKSPK